MTRLGDLQPKAPKKFGSTVASQLLFALYWKKILASPLSMSYFGNLVNLLQNV